ncbi:unnamed protein product [Sympodiomycopsis kandeliae]
MASSSSSSSKSARHGTKKASSSSEGRRRGRRQSSSPPVEVIDIASNAGGSKQDEDEEMEEVDVGSQADGEDMEEVNVSQPPTHDEYAAVHLADAAEHDGTASDVEAEVPVFHDGKGQMRGANLPPDTPSGGKGISITLDKQDTEQSSAKRPRTNFVTPRDRSIRSASHKLHVLALLAHAKIRNQWLNDENLRDYLYNITPVGLRQKLRAIHPKKEPSQRERVRLFEALMGELVRWWAVKFYLDPDMTAASAIRQPDQDLVAGKYPKRGRRVDGWIVENEADRDRREQAKRRTTNPPSKSKSKQKGKAKEPTSTPRRTYRPLLRFIRNPRDSITLFPPSASEQIPTYFHLLTPPTEPLHSSHDLLNSAETRTGSRETSSQLFCALCRSLGIPARLVISPQVAPWSISAAKISQQGGQKKKKEVGQRFARRGTDEDTSDDDDYNSGEINGSGGNDGFQIAGVKSTPKRKGNDGFEVAGVKSTPSRKGEKGFEVAGVKSTPYSRGRKVATASTSAGTPARIPAGTASRPASVASTISIPDDSDDDKSKAIDVDSQASSSRPTRGKGKAKAKAGAGAEEKQDDDYRDEKWKGLTTPLEVEYKPKLRTFQSKPKENSLAAQDLSDVPPVDLTAPPTMWVEVFSKPFQKWLTVDPIRARVSPTGNRQMEPLPYDRSNKLVYVVAFEEDGYARDVTARYTKTLHSRVSKLRPPNGSTRSTRQALGAEEEDNSWWASVVRSLHRPEQLERDAAEDVELEEAANKEPMPNSIGGFKDHPIFILERFLKRDEAFHPQIQVGTFQGIPVFHRRNIVVLRSARQWYSEGRVVKSNAGEPLKWVKSRGYTLQNKRLAEQARQEGNEDSLLEGLYSKSQTELYRAPAVIKSLDTNSYIIPKNHFGNIDLFVPSMLPPGSIHLPYTGISKIAKKLKIDYAEAIVGFEFRKHRSNPKINGIVIPEEFGEMVLREYREAKEMEEENEVRKRREKGVKLWKKVLNGLSIAKRVQEQYGPQSAGGQEDATAAGGSKRKRQWQRQRQPSEGEQEAETTSGGGGFVVSDDDAGAETGGGGFMVSDDEQAQPEAGGFMASDEDEPPRGGFMATDDDDEEHPTTTTTTTTSEAPPPVSKMSAKLSKYGTNRLRSDLAIESTSTSDDDEQGGDGRSEGEGDEFMSASGSIHNAEDKGESGGPIVSLEDLIAAESNHPKKKTNKTAMEDPTPPTPTKRRRIVLRNKNPPPSEEQPKQSMGTRRSTRNAARSQRSMREESFDDE